MISLRGLSQQPKTCYHVYHTHTKVTFKGSDNIKSNQMNNEYNVRKTKVASLSVITGTLVAELDCRYKSYKDLKQSFEFRTI